MTSPPFQPHVVHNICLTVHHGPFHGIHSDPSICSSKTPSLLISPLITINALHSLPANQPNAKTANLPTVKHARQRTPASSTLVSLNNQSPQSLRLGSFFFLFLSSSKSARLIIKSASRIESMMPKSRSVGLSGGGRDETHRPTRKDDIPSPFLLSSCSLFFLFLFLFSLSTKTTLLRVE